MLLVNSTVQQKEYSNGHNDIPEEVATLLNILWKDNLGNMGKNRQCREALQGILGRIQSSGSIRGRTQI